MQHTGNKRSRENIPRTLLFGSQKTTTRKLLENFTGTFIVDWDSEYNSIIKGCCFACAGWCVKIQLWWRWFRGPPVWLSGWNRQRLPWRHCPCPPLTRASKSSRFDKHVKDHHMLMFGKLLWICLPCYKINKVWVRFQVTTLKQIHKIQLIIKNL